MLVHPYKFHMVKKTDTIAIPAGTHQCEFPLLSWFLKNHRFSALRSFLQVCPIYLSIKP